MGWYVNYELYINKAGEGEGKGEGGRERETHAGYCGNAWNGLPKNNAKVNYS